MDEETADLLVDAYFRSGKDPRKMAEILEVPVIELDILSHPVFRRKVIERAKQNSQSYSMSEHMEMLKEIRDKALDDTEGRKPNFKAALSAEIQLGTAAGLYEKGAGEDDKPGVDPEKLSTNEIRALLMKAIKEDPVALPAPRVPEPEVRGSDGDEI